MSCKKLELQILNNIMEAKKKKYILPKIEIIAIDNEISLALESSPPDGPGEGTSLTPHYINNDPFRNNLS